MNWRRLADMLTRRPAPPDDERSTQAKRLQELEEGVKTTIVDLQTLAAGAHDRLASYRRTRIRR